MTGEHDNDGDDAVDGKDAGRRWHIGVYYKILGELVDLIDSRIEYYKLKDAGHLQRWLIRRYTEHCEIDGKALHARTGIPGRWPKPKRAMLVRRPRSSKNRQIDKEGAGEHDASSEYYAGVDDIEDGPGYDRNLDPAYHTLRKLVGLDPKKHAEMLADHVKTMNKYRE